MSAVQIRLYARLYQEGDKITVIYPMISDVISLGEKKRIKQQAWKTKSDFREW